MLFERPMQIFLCIHQWREENEWLGLAPDLTDMWTPEQRKRFLRDWQVDEVLNQVNYGEKRTHDEMMDEEEPSTSHQGALQTGRGDNHERPFYVESVRQVYTKKFRTNVTSYRVRFTNAFADVEIASCHEQLHEIFQQILDETVRGVPCTTTIMTSSPKCPDSLPAFTTATPVRKPTTTTKNTCARMNASVAGFLPFVLKSPGQVAKTAIDSSRVSGVTISINNRKAMPRSIRQTLVRCMKCMEVVDRHHQAPEKHLCGKRKCGICGKYVQLEGHRCYIQSETKKCRKAAMAWWALRYGMSTGRTKRREQSGRRVHERTIVL